MCYKVKTGKGGWENLGGADIEEVNLLVTVGFYLY